MCETKVQFQDVWILNESRVSVQYLSNWTSTGHQTSLDILNLLDRIFSNHRVYFQWVPSHVGIDGNEKADFLARTATEEEVSSTGYLTFSELSSLKKIELHHLGRTPSHSWYFGRNPGGGSFMLMPRQYQTAKLNERAYKSSHFATGSENISRVPLVLFRARLSCTHLDLLGFQRGGSPSATSSVFRLS
ncbi:uncharacterized protein TNCV_4156641 [Trichonephila clavipes]|nr:uncharacterized protein TNCV_4156641 [Trichonephila clavipes]